MKPSPNWTDTRIKNALLGSKKNREEVFEYLYCKSGLRQWVIRYVCENSGDTMTGEDVFQEALIIFDRNLREGKFRGECGLKTYLLGIARQYWFNRRRSQKNHQGLDNREYNSLTQESPEICFLCEERRRIIDAIMEKIGDHCKRVLTYYKLSLSNEEIAREMGLSSPDMAKKYTYRCRKRFRSYVMKNEYLKSWLLS